MELLRSFSACTWFFVYSSRNSLKVLLEPSGSGFSPRRSKVRPRSAAFIRARTFLANSFDVTGVRDHFSRLTRRRQTRPHQGHGHLSQLRCLHRLYSPSVL